MRLLDLISTPVPVLNTLGLDVAVGLSSEDPVGDRRPSEPYVAYLTIYAPDGTLAERVELGEIPPHSRRRFDVSARTRTWFPAADHLVVVHRIPRRLLAGGRAPDAAVELAAADRDAAMMRSVVEYSLPGGAAGSVLYETPPRLNVPRPGRAPSSTLTFTSMVVISDGVSTYLPLVHYSLDPAYDRVAHYAFGFFAASGELVATGTRAVRPFSVELVDARGAIPPAALARHRDPDDGMACFGYVGCCADASLIRLVLQLAPARGAVAVEHTHAAQAYTMPQHHEDKNAVKARAVDRWAARLASA